MKSISASIVVLSGALVLTGGSFVSHDQTQGTLQFRWPGRAGGARRVVSYDPAIGRMRRQEAHEGERDASVVVHQVRRLAHAAARETRRMLRSESSGIPEVAPGRGGIVVL